MKTICLKMYEILEIIKQKTVILRTLSKYLILHLQIAEKIKKLSWELLKNFDMILENT